MPIPDISGLVNKYKDTAIDLASGAGKLGGGAPRLPDGAIIFGDGSNNDNWRHCAAWEQVRRAFILIADCMEEVGCSDKAEEVRSLAEECKMEYNRGE